ncbi:putative reverse transcriptase domain-containing protein [Tanacetum coccineum]
MGLWLCGVCFKTHTLRTKCLHGTAFVPPPDNGDGVVRFVLYDLIKPEVLLNKLATAESVSSMLDLGGIKGLKVLHEVVCVEDGLRAQHLIDCLSGADVAVLDDLVSSITQVVNLFLAGKCPMMLGKYIASAPLTPLVKPGSGIRPIVVGTVWRRLVSKVSATMVGHSLDVNRLVEDRGDDVGLSMLLVDFQNAFNLVDRKVMLEKVRLRFPAISRWVEFCYSSPARLYYGEHTLWVIQGVQQGDPLGPLLFSLVLRPLICKSTDSFSLCLQAWYLDDDTIVGDTLVVEKVLELIVEDGPRCGLHLNVDKPDAFFGPKSTPEAELKVELAMKGVSKTIVLMDTVAHINDPQCVATSSGFVLSPLWAVFDDWQWRTRTPLPFAIWGVWRYLQLLVPPLMMLWGYKDAVSLFPIISADGTMAISREESPLNWLRAVPISGLLQGLYGDHAVSCAGIVGIKHRHNLVRDTLVDICYRSGISSGKEVDIGLGSSPLTHINMVDFVPGRAATKAAQRKRVKYEAKCADIRYGFLPFSFSSFGELEKDAVTLLKRIRKFSMAQDIGARAAIHIFNMISFAIAK